MDRYEVAENKTSSKGGCHCSVVVGFLLVLLAIAIAVGVGVIVHFAGDAGRVECKCTFPDSDAVKTCVSLARRANTEICDACPRGGPTTTPAVTEPQTTTTTVAIETTTTTEPSVEADFRLPADFAPLLYTLELQPNFYSGDESDFDFDGKCSILLKCNNDTDVITLHMRDITLTVGAISVVEENTLDELHESHSLDESVSFLKIKTTAMLKAGRNYVVNFPSYKGLLDNDPWGLYYDSYKQGNETVYLTTSQMQVVDARQVFPGFDEPAMKAQFDVTIIHKDHMKSLSNMPILRSELRGDNLVADIYERTPVMSTYLLAFVVSDFDSIEQTTPNNVSVRIWSRPEAVSGTAFALDLGVKALTYFEDYFNIPFPLPKQDMMAIQNFDFGSMENWGLIMFLEDSLIYEEDVSSPEDKRTVAMSVTHEISHMWFGDLVSPSWWDDIWLNEGFATYMEYVGVASIQPDLHIFDFFVTNVLERGLQADGFVTSHPAYVYFEDPDEIWAMFDAITYEKGAAIIRMLNFFLGEETFRKGLERYLTSFEYGNARKDDLWYAFGNQSKADGNDIVDVKAIMDTWTNQMNYPIVKIDFTQDNTIAIQQSRYIEASDYEDPETFQSQYNYRWDIPFTYTSSKEANFDQNASDVILLKHDIDTYSFANPVRIPSLEPDVWVIGNVEGYGFYRVNYDERNWQALIKQLTTDHAVIDSSNRAQLISDSWSFVKAGKLDLDVALSVIGYISGEMELAPRTSFANAMDQPRSLLRTQPVYGAFREFLMDSVSGAFEHFGVNDTGAPFIESYMRGEVGSFACGVDLPACVAKATALFNQWMDDAATNPIPQTLRTSFYCTAVRHGGVAEWEFAFRQMQIENVIGERNKLVQAITCTEEASLIARTMESILDPNVIARADVYYTAKYLALNHVALSSSWDFTRINYDEMVDRMGEYYLMYLLQYMAEGFSSELRVTEVKAFGEEHELSDIRDFQKVIEIIENNIEWMERHYATFQTWLADQGY